MLRKAIAFLSLMALLICSYSFAAAPEFSADMSMSLSNGKAMTGKIFIKADKVRTEMKVMGYESITIARQDKKVTWLLMPAQKQYREMALKADPSHPTSDMQYDIKEIGTGKANGYDCKLTQYTFKNAEYGIVVNWMATKINMPVRVQVKNKSGALVTTIDYTNIKIGPQADALFEIPSGYTKL